MPKRTSHPRLVAVPRLKEEPLYIGIAVGKSKHIAGLVSATLLQRHERFEACPAIAFENSREGFRSLVEGIQGYAPLAHCSVLIAVIGHYHKVLTQYLQELDVPVFLG